MIVLPLNSDEGSIYGECRIQFNLRVLLTILEILINTDFFDIDGSSV